MNIRKFSLTFLFVVIIVSIYVIPLPVSADYSYSGIHWDSDYVYYNAMSLPQAWRTAIMTAHYSWNQTGANWSFGHSSSATRYVTTGSAPSNIPAYCIIQYSGNHIFQADMYFNDEDFDFYTNGDDYDVETIALHEFGHWLMLNDTSSSGEVMYGGYEGLKRDLSDEDIEGIIAIYGEG